MNKKYNFQEQELPEINESLAVNAYTSLTSDCSLYRKSMPCSFTDEEWIEEIRLSEESGIANEEETANFYKKWGIAL